ncbi:hypothetical protein BGX34_008847 [Mortierella sp. NVP85]|nr:hypothetical protein BGX34_008847 [Mortierella sp. NVP85]
MSDWKKLIDAKRSGAEYFLRQKGALVCDPEAYAKARFPQRREQEIVVSEWASWMRDFKSSKSKELRDAAKNAPKLCRMKVKEVRIERFGQIQKQCQEDHKDPEVKSRKIVAAWLRNQYLYQCNQRAKQARKARMAEKKLKAKEEEEKLKVKVETLKVEEEETPKVEEEETPKVEKEEEIEVKA